MGLGWKQKKEHLDIDASVITLDKDGQVIDLIYFSNKLSKEGSIIHGGDNLSGGDGQADNETITIDLNTLSQSVDSIWPVVSIYKYDKDKGKNFKNVENAYCRLMEGDSGKEFLRFNLSGNQDNISNGNIIGYLKR